MPICLPDNRFETDLLMRGCTAIAGVDEVGRGPLAGPVYAAAVILNPDAVPAGLNDSKKLTERARERLAADIERCADVSIGIASVAEIDSMNILRAAHLAMARALSGLGSAVDHALIDGNALPEGIGCPATPIIGGDGRSVSIAAASIVAKVARDRLMVDLAQQHPGYGWERNKGYGTFQHLSGLRNLGVTPHHRRSFKPVHNILYQENISNS